MRFAAPSLALAALLLAGCATTYQVTLMPRTSGKLYTGTLQQTADGEGTMTITIESTTYTGTVVETSPSRTSGFVTGGIGAPRGRVWGSGATVTMDNPKGGTAKALLQSPDGKGLRCDLRDAGRTGGGSCRDDQGLEYDVQLRPAARP